MAKRRVKRLPGLQPEVVAAFERKSFNTCKDVLGVPPIDLVELVGVSSTDVQAVVASAARAVAPTPISVNRLLSAGTNVQASRRYLPTSLVPLDTSLRGGLLKGTITEVVGPSGCGKTQFCTMMAVQAALPVSRGGMDKPVLYIDTEGAFSAERLLQVARCRCGAIAPDDDVFLLETVDRVNVVVEGSCAGLLARLQRLEEAIIAAGFGLVIVDSIASLIRKEFGSHSSDKRADLLATEAALLKYIAEAFSIPVIVTNQVTTKLDDDFGANDGNSFVTTALGNTWSHSVNTRLLLEYTSCTEGRMITIVKSPLARTAASPYSIDDAGLISTGESVEPGTMVTINPRITVKSAPGAGNIEARGAHSMMLLHQ